MDAAVIIAIIAVVLTILGLASQHFLVISGIKERLSALETKIGLFWKVVERKMADSLKEPTHARKDLLIDLLKNGTITITEAEELRDIIDQETECGNGCPDVAHVLVLARLEALIYDLKRKTRGK